MSSWALLLALSGFKCDMVNGTIHFLPKINRENFKVFWSTGTAWGTFSRRIDSITKKVENDIKVLYGDLEGVKVFVDNQLAASF